MLKALKERYFLLLGSAPRFDSCIPFSYSFIVPALLMALDPFDCMQRKFMEEKGCVTMSLGSLGSKVAFGMHHGSVLLSRGYGNLQNSLRLFQ
jgi:hypothetical protein